MAVDFRVSDRTGTSPFELHPLTLIYKICHACHDMVSKAPLENRSKSIYTYHSHLLRILSTFVTISFENKFVNYEFYSIQTSFT